MSQLKSLETSEHEEQGEKNAENSFSPTIAELIFFYFLPHFFHHTSCREVDKLLNPTDFSSNKTSLTKTKTWIQGSGRGPDHSINPQQSC